MFGIIKNCNKYFSKCNYKCCTFNKNYIVLYPGEFESSDQPKNHIKIIDDNYFGGKKAVCINVCKKDEFKPIDCSSYPYFPKINNKGDISIIKGTKCPLKENELVNHRKKFLDIWNLLIKNKEIYEWLENIKLIGYKEIEGNKIKNK